MCSPNGAAVLEGSSPTVDDLDRGLSGVQYLGGLDLSYSAPAEQIVAVVGQV